jgi:hypothetical protein
LPANGSAPLEWPGGSPPFRRRCRRQAAPDRAGPPGAAHDSGYGRRAHHRSHAPDQGQGRTPARPALPQGGRANPGQGHCAVEGSGGARARSSKFTSPSIRPGADSPLQHAESAGPGGPSSGASSRASCGASQGGPALARQIRATSHRGPGHARSTALCASPAWPRCAIGRHCGGARARTRRARREAREAEVRQVSPPAPPACRRQRPPGLPAAVRKAVWERDGGQCTFVSEKGKRCESCTRLEFDHVEPVARGGQASVGGIRLRCRAHDQYSAERAFGSEFMQGKRQEARARMAGARPGAPDCTSPGASTPTR